jgi:hypothetical protein
MGTEGHELFAALPGYHRRLHRNRHAGPMVRRQYRPAGVRQEHARLPDGHGPGESPVAHGLRRHDPGRQLDGVKLDIVSAFQSYGEYIAGTIDETAGGPSSEKLPGGRRLRRHVHGQHHGLGHRSHGHVAALQRQPPGRFQGKADECPRSGRPSGAAGRRHPPAIS